MCRRTRRARLLGGDQEGRTVVISDDDFRKKIKTLEVVEQREYTTNYIRPKQQQINCVFLVSFLKKIR